MAINTLDFLKGARPVLEVSDWVTGGGAGTFSDFGAVSDVEVDIKNETKDITSDSTLYALDTYYTGQSILIKGTMHEAQLQKLARALGYDPDTAVATVARVPSTTAGTNTFSIEEPGAVQYYQIRLTVSNQSMKPGNDTYTGRVATFWRCVFQADVKQAFKKDDHVKIPFSIKVYYDSTATPKLGKVVDTAPA